MLIHAKPAKGARVRQPERNSAVMAEGGAWISRNAFYEARILAGDLIISDPQPEMPKASKPAAPAAAPQRNTTKEI